MLKPKKTLAIILSGGAGERVDGRDKGLLPYKDRPLVSHVLEKLEPQVDDSVVCIHRNLENYEKLASNLVMDAAIEYEGPMAGISAALNQLKTNSTLLEYQYFAVSPCDVPSLLPDHVSRLKSALLEHKADVAVAHDGERKQNLHCLLSSEAVDSLLDFYSGGGRAMHRWFDCVKTVEVDFSDAPQAFRNLNSSAQLNR